MPKSMHKSSRIPASLLHRALRNPCPTPAPDVGTLCRVLHGACQLLVSKNVKFVIFEFNPRLMNHRTQVDAVQILQILSNIGKHPHPNNQSKGRPSWDFLMSVGLKTAKFFQCARPL